MRDHLLVIIKPDGVTKGLIGPIFTKLAEADLDILAAKVLRVGRKLAEEHYKHINDQPFFGQTVDLLTGKFHERKYVLVFVLSGENGIKRCRKLIGATNPEDADPTSIRGEFGRITTKGVYENVIHASSDPKEAEREIKLWFTPDEIINPLYPTRKTRNGDNEVLAWA